VDIVPYVGPLVPPGAGFHRLVLALYRQRGEVDPSVATGGDISSLSGRYIDNVDLINRLGLMSKGLCFFQATHDDSVEARFAALGKR